MSRIEMSDKDERQLKKSVMRSPPASRGGPRRSKTDDHAYRHDRLRRALRQRSPDIVSTLAGSDTIDLGAGNDIAFGGQSSDMIDGRDGDDRVSGGSDLFLIAFCHAEGLQYTLDSSNDEANEFIRDFTRGKDALQIRYNVEGFKGNPSDPGIILALTVNDLDSDGVLDADDSSINLTNFTFAGRTAASLVIDTSLFGVESLAPADINSAPLT